MPLDPPHHLNGAELKYLAASLFLRKKRKFTLFIRSAAKFTICYKTYLYLSTVRLSLGFGTLDFCAKIYH